MVHFGKVLSKAVKNGITAKSIKNGFRACGLQPFNPNAVDYSRCIATTVIAEPPISPDSFAPPGVLQPIVEGKPENTMQQNRIVDRNVSISIDRIIEAYDLIGADAIAKIEGDVRLLSREERIIRFFYREFVRPHIDFHELPSSNETYFTSDDQHEFDSVSNTVSTENHANASSLPMDIDINNCEIIHIEDIGAFYGEFSNLGELGSGNLVGETSDLPPVETNHTELNESNDSNERVMNHTENCSPQDYTEIDETSENNATETFIKSPCVSLKDVTNKQNITRRRLSSVLKLPPTPRRVTKHRNYVRQYHPILTAGERLDEIRKKEDQKEQMEQQKKKKAKERQEAKQKREETKKAKAAERERKKMESKQKKFKVKVKKELVMIRD